MSKPAIFLDRDGVINKDTGYVSQVDDFHFLPGAIEAMQLLKKKGYLLVRQCRPRITCFELLA